MGEHTIASSRFLAPQPQISLHSFVFGFVVGCAAVYLLHNIICGSEGCSYDQKQILVRVEALPSRTHVEEEDFVNYGNPGPSRERAIRHKLSRSSHRTAKSSGEGRIPVTESINQIQSTSKTEGIHAAAVIDTMDNKGLKPLISKSKSGCPSLPMHIVILVLSAPGGIIRRNAIRGTWLHNYHSGMLKVTSRFLIGTKKLLKEKVGNLTVEQNQFGDLLLFDDLKDSYSNLSAKVLLGLKWAHRTQKFDFLIKTDDDSYVRIDQVAKNIQRMNCDDRLYWGYFMGHALPEPSGKWAEYKWFNCPHYLPYAMGGGYVLSGRLVALIVRFSHRLKLYNNEDVTVGSWLAPFNLNRKHDIRFDVESMSHGCNNEYIITHKERVRSLYEKYTNLLKNGTICDVEKEIRPAYIYNWSVAPVDCCVRTRGLQVGSEKG